MKKSSLILLILTLVFGALAVYFALRASDASQEGATTQKSLDAQRVANRDLFEAKAKLKLLEEVNEASLAENKRLLEENDSQKNSIASKDKDAGKMKLFADNLKKENEQLKSAAGTAEARISALEKKLSEEQKRSESLNGELVEIRSIEGRKEYEDRISALKKNIEEQKKTIEEKDAALEDAEKQRKELAEAKDKEIAARDSEIAELKENPRIKQLEEELLAEKEKSAKLQAANTSLRKKVR